MAAKLIFKYDREGDILYIDKCPPYPEQESEELGDDVIARLNPVTGEIENLEVLFFSTRLLCRGIKNLILHRCEWHNEAWLNTTLGRRDYGYREARASTPSGR
jgi:uncharacterized protein YuzE